jgi:hypothetical protein
VANTLVAVLWAYSINRWMKTSSFMGVGTDVGVLILCVALFAASRDALSKYYARTGRLVGQISEKDLEDKIMYNGNHHQVEGGASTKPRPDANTAHKPEPSPKAEPGKTKPAHSPK